MTDETNRLDASLDAEIEAALGDASIEDMLDYADRPSGEREFRKGRIVNVYGDDVFVEFGPKSQGICPLAQFQEKPQVGTEMDFIVERFDRNDGILVLSREGGVRKAAWDALDVGQVIEAKCTGTNKGGLEMEVANHRAFMPAGQVDVRHVEDLEVFVNEKMPCEIIELDRNRGRIILSRRAHLERERARQRESTLASLQVGDTITATVTSLQSFGAFADLGGVDGLIHISDLSYDRISDPGQAVQVGDTVNVKVLKIDDSQDPPRIGLGLKQTLEDPFTEEMGKLEVGGTVSGRVTKLMAFGAFVELAPGVEGLIHISELSHERVNRVSSVVRPDEVVKVKILSIDPGSRRIALSIKALQSSGAGEVERQEDPSLRKLRAQLSAKFGDNLKGGLG